MGLGLTKVGTLLGQTLKQEEAADQALTKLAVSELNAAANEDETNDGDSSPATALKSKRRGAA